MHETHHALDPELTRFEAMLRALPPNSPTLDRDRLMFQSGQAAARRQARPRLIWPAAACIFACVSLVQSLSILRPDSHPRATPPLARSNDNTPSVHPEAPLSTPSVTTRPSPARYDLGQTAHQRLLWQIARYGLDALPARAPVAAAPTRQPATSADLLRQELDRLSDPGDAT